MKTIRVFLNEDKRERYRKFLEDSGCITEIVDDKHICTHPDFDTIHVLTVMDNTVLHGLQYDTVIVDEYDRKLGEGWYVIVN